MELYPAVDVRGGRVARVPPGQPDDPLTVARAGAAAGARWLHFVDLDRAYAQGDNRALARAVLAQAGLRVQVGGGLNDPAAIAEMLDWGAARVVVGARAAADPSLLARLVAAHGAARLAVAIDGKAGRVAPREAQAPSLAPLDLPVSVLAERAAAHGVRTVVYTDVTRDGALAGPDLDGARALAAVGGGLAVIVSGGVATLDDLARARDAGLAGAVVGRALLDGRFTIQQALACLAA